MSNIPNEPTWIAEGTEVAVSTGGHYGTTEFVKIERLTATTIVLADGRRYQRTGYYRQIGKNSGPDTQLRDPQDPHALSHYARMLLRDVAREARSTTEGSRATVQTMDPQQVRDELNRIADVINDKRKELDRRAGL